MKAPCKNCPNRSIECHSTCLTYIDYAQKRAVERHEISEKKATINMIRSHKRYMCEKARRKHERH